MKTIIKDKWENEYEVDMSFSYKKVSDDKWDINVNVQYITTDYDGYETTHHRKLSYIINDNYFIENVRVMENKEFQPHFIEKYYYETFEQLINIDIGVL